MSIGAHNIKAYYSGDDVFESAASTALSQSVGQAATSTTLLSLTSPSIVGQNVILSASVGVVAPGSGFPTGTVTFTDGATVLGSVTLVNGAVQFGTSGLSTGSHALTATYNGDTNFAASAGSVTQQVNRADSNIALALNPNPSLLGQAVTLTASLGPVIPGTGGPTGDVVFSDNATVLGTAPIVDGVASLTISTLGTGAHVITADYNGDVNFNASTVKVTQVVTLNIVSVKALNNLASESGSFKGQFELTRTGGSPLPLTVNFTLGGTAIEGLDYATIGGSAVIPAGQDFVDIDVNALADALFEGDESVIITLTPSATYNLGTVSTARVTILDNNTFLFTSGPIVSLNPALVGQSVSFTVATNAPLATYAWNFGDGTSDTTGSATVSHVYAAPMTAAVTVTATGPGGQTITAQLFETITTNPADVDTDGDGISDGIEMAAGTDSNDPLSLPVTNADDPNPLPLNNLSAQLNFTRSGADSISIVGYVSTTTLPLVSNADVIIDAGGVIQRFKTDAKGKAKVIKSTFTILPAINKIGQRKFVVKLIGAYTDKLADEGLTNETVTNRQTSIKVRMVVSGLLFEVNQPQFYTAKKGSRGKSK